MDSGKLEDTARLLNEMYRAERFHGYVLWKLSDFQTDAGLKRLLTSLAEEENKHAVTWARLAEKKVSNVTGGEVLSGRFLVFISRIFGIELAIKIMEYNESVLKKRLEALTSDCRIKDALEVEEKTEERFEAKILGYSEVLNNIRDVVFGMNDGLVEILAAISGIGAALQQPSLVLAAGLIVAISGTLSMAGGAYLSTDYENSIGMKKRKNYKGKDAKMSAFYVGIAYIFGALFPLLPFIFGASGYIAIAISICITAVVLVIVSSIISVVSDTSIVDRAAKTLAISLGISAITIILGIYARAYLHLSI